MSVDELAVTAKGLSKVYRIGLKEKSQDTLSRAAIEFIRSPLKNYRKYRSLYKFDDVFDFDSTASGAVPADIIWALRDVSFDIKRGEVVGFIGRNGAGKSTLLKILTRITPPTHGHAEIRGRVSSLLEVGTGFHGELTGRENIYLNGTILGMTKREVARKFDEIVDFSGVERFLDTPVKRYSSGMTVRLAFAVAAHLEPEILIIDEVLAVGDAVFQKKCISKMQDVQMQGRTVLFVSHNMAAVSMLCTRAIMLDGGKIVMDGHPGDVIGHYLSSDSTGSAEREWLDTQTAPGGNVARLYSIRVIDRDGRTARSIDIRKDVGIEMVFDVIQPGYRLLPHYQFYNEGGTEVFTSLNQDPKWYLQPYPVGRYASTVWIPGNFLSSGAMLVTASLITRSPDNVQFHERQIVSFNIRDNMGLGTARGDWGGDISGVVRPVLKWTTRMFANSSDLADAAQKES
jgi:lipopolysaccharide transport system ATP-binding protein